MKELSERFQKLSPIMQFTAFITGLIILFLLVKSLKGTIQGVGSGVTSTSTLVTLSAQGVKPSYTSDKYLLWADRLEYAMDGSGTDEQIIYNVYRYMKNDADMVKLNQAFGIRDDATLNQWIKGDVDIEIIAELNKQLREKGITKTIK